MELGGLLWGGGPGGALLLGFALAKLCPYATFKYRIHPPIPPAPDGVLTHDSGGGLDPKGLWGTGVLRLRRDGSASLGRGRSLIRLRCKGERCFHPKRSPYTIPKGSGAFLTLWVGR